MADKVNEHETKVQTHLDNAIEYEHNKDLTGANRQFKFAAFYEGKRLGIPAKEYAVQCGDPYPETK
jgi:hypothetical protein